MVSVLVRRPSKNTDTQGEDHVETEAEAGLMHTRVKEYEVAANPGSQVGSIRRSQLC